MTSQKVALFLAVITIMHMNAFSDTVPSPNCDADACKLARLYCPNTVIICEGPNQEIRHTGWCNCCFGCFNISQIGGPCGSSSRVYKCAKGLRCVNDVCQN